jgi:hypothetical protein
MIGRQGGNDVDRRTLGELEYRMRHRHGDEWVPMDRQPLHHGASEHDAERGWLRGVLFRCRTCDEDVILAPEEDTTGR